MNLEQWWELGYGPESPMLQKLQKYQRDMATSLEMAEMIFTLIAHDAEKLMAAFADINTREPAEEPDVEWGCCDNPRPRILEANGRLFCRSCLKYLDTQREDGGASSE